MRKSTKHRSKIKPGRRRIKDPQDKKLCMTKGQLMNVVIAAEVEGYKDAKKKRKAQKCCPKATQFIRELKMESKA